MSEYIGSNYVDKKIRKNNLKVVSEYLNKNDIEWTLICGTLLGCMREKDFIDWDADIDIGIVGKDFRKLDINYFINHGFKGLKNCFLYKKTTISRNGCNVDFHNIKEKKDAVLFDIGNTFQYEIFRKISLFIKNKTGLKQEPLLEQSRFQILQHMLTLPKYKHFPKCEFVEYTFTGIRVYIPSRWKDWLILLYGENWEIPNPDYTSSEERQNNRRKKKL